MRRAPVFGKIGSSRSAVCTIGEGETMGKVLLINGSPNEHGCTYTALKELEKTLQKEGLPKPVYEERIHTNFIR